MIYDPLPIDIIFTKNVLIIKAVEYWCINMVNAHISGYCLQLSFFFNNKCGCLISY